MLRRPPIALALLALFAPLSATAAPPPTAARLQRDEGTKHLQAKRYREAVSAFGNAVSMAPEFAEAWVDLGNAHLALEDYRSAARAFQGALVARPQFAIAEYNLAYSLRKAGDFDRSAEAYRVYLQHTPDDADAHYGLAEALRGAGDKAGAAEAYDRYADLERRPNRASWIRSAREQAASLRGEPPPPPETEPDDLPAANAAAPQPAAVPAFAGATLAQVEGAPPPRRKKSAADRLADQPDFANRRPFGFEVGLQALQRADFEGALQPLESAARASPGDPLVLAALASAQLGMGDYDEAIANYRRAARDTPPQGFAALQLGIAEALRLKGEPAEAAEGYRRVLDDPNAPVSVKRVASERLGAPR